MSDKETIKKGNKNVLYKMNPVSNVSNKKTEMKDVFRMLLLYNMFRGWWTKWQMIIVGKRKRV